MLEAWHAWFTSHLYLILLLTGAGYVVVIALKWRGLRRTVPVSGSYGTAAFGTIEDARQAGLTEGPGIVLGKMGKTYLRLPHLMHAIFVGPTRSGKTTQAISTILSWPGSGMFCSPKRSLIDHTMIHRRGSDGKNPMYVFAPADPMSPDRINPFTMIRWQTSFEARDASRMAHRLTTSDEIDVRTDASTYYRSGAQSVLLFGLLITQSSPAALRRWLLQAPHLPKHFRAWLEGFTSHSNSVVVDGAQFLLRQPDSELPKWWAAGINWLDPWIDPILAHNTETTTVPLLSLQTGERPATLYIHVSAEDLIGPLGRLVKLILEQWRTLTHESTVPRRHRLLVLFDDMAEFKRFSLIQHSAALDAEYGWQLLMLVQSFNQLFEVLGSHASLLDNCSAMVVYCPNHPETAEFVSKKLGRTTVMESTERVSRSGIFGRSQVSSGVVAHARELMTLGEVQLIAPDEVLIFINGRKPFLVKQARWYENAAWAACVPDAVRRHHGA